MLVNVPGAPVMFYRLDLRAGYYLSPKNKWETPHVLEHMMASANQNLPNPMAFSEEKEKNGGYFNAYTSLWSLGYIGECADMEWERVLNLLGDTLTAPLLSQQRLEVEMGSVREELIGFLNHYPRILAVESGIANNLQLLQDSKRIEMLNNVDLDDVKYHYQKTHTKQNIRFIIGGNFTTAKRKKLLGILDRIYGSLGDGQRFAPPDGKPSGLNKALVVKRQDVEKLYYTIDFFYPSSGLSDEELDPASVLIGILTGSMSSRIKGKAREQGIAYDVASYITDSHTYTNFGLAGTVSYENSLSLIKLVSRELRSILDGFLGDREVEAAKLQSLGRFQRGAQRTSDIVNGYADWYFFDERIEDCDQVPERIRAVTKKQIIDVFHKIMDPRCWSIGLLGRVAQTEADKLWAITDKTIYG